MRPRGLLDTVLYQSGKIPQKYPLFHTECIKIKVCYNNVVIMRSNIEKNT